MTLIERLHTIRAHLRTGALGQREVWEAWLTEAADALEANAEIERLRRENAELVRENAQINRDSGAEIERLRVEQGVVQEQHAYIERLERLLAADAIRKGE